MKIRMLPVGSGQTNCYMLSGEDFAAVIDPGEIDSEILSFGEQNCDKKYKYIILTHCHFDHITGVLPLKSVFDAPIVACIAEVEGLKNPEINLSGKWSKTEVSFSPDITVSDGDEIVLGEEKLSVIQTAGHTVGSICLAGEDMIFTGDTLFNLSVGRYDMPTSSVRALINSLKRLGALSRNYTLYPGHGDKTTLNFEKQHNTFFKRVLEEF